MKHQETLAYILAANFIANDIMQLELDPVDYVKYEAGQYLQVFFDKESFYFSIANAPTDAQHYHLHIRINRQSKLYQCIQACVDAQQPLRIHLPFGICSVSHLEPQKPILFLAEGTGFAQSHAMIEDLMKRHERRELQLIWAARAQNLLYLDETVKQWENNCTNFRYVPVLTGNPREHLIAHALSLHVSDIEKWQIVLSGSFDMVYRIRDGIVALGVSKQNIYSDAFEFEELNQ